MCDCKGTNLTENNKEYEYTDSHGRPRPEGTPPVEEDIKTNRHLQTEIREFPGKSNGQWGKTGILTLHI